VNTERERGRLQRDILKIIRRKFSKEERKKKRKLPERSEAKRKKTKEKTQIPHYFGNTILKKAKIQQQKENKRVKLRREA
jgi:hypothetical protein